LLHLIVASDYIYVKKCEHLFSEFNTYINFLILMINPCLLSFSLGLNWSNFVGIICFSIIYFYGMLFSWVWGTTYFGTAYFGTTYFGMFSKKSTNDKLFSVPSVPESSLSVPSVQKYSFFVPSVPNS